MGVDSWKDKATAELEEIKNQSGNMVPEDRVARTMDLQEDIAAKVGILVKNAATEKDLLPQGDKVPQDAQDFKDELNRITKDVKFWAEYRTGIKEFTPWLESSEGACSEGLTKPSNLDEVKALHEKVGAFAKSCASYLKVLQAADAAAKKMTTHEGADKEVAALMKEWQLLDNTVTELNTWVAKDKSSEGENQFSLEKMESALGELKNIFKQKEKLVD